MIISKTTIAVVVTSIIATSLACSGDEVRPRLIQERLSPRAADAGMQPPTYAWPFPDDDADRESLRYVDHVTGERVTLLDRVCEARGYHR